MIGGEQDGLHAFFFGERDARAAGSRGVFFSHGRRRGRASRGLGDEPLLFGRLAQPVLADELTWTIDTREDDQRVLCIEIPKKPWPSGKPTAMTVTTPTRTLRS